MSVSEILPPVCELTAYVTTDYLEKHLCSNEAVEIVARAIFVISFIISDIRCIFQDIGP